jgi:hypothetical protein
MTKGVLFIAVLAALVLGVLYFGYGSYSAKRAGASGDVYSNDSTSGRLKPSTDTDSSNSTGPRAVSSTTEVTKPVTYPPAAEQAARADDTAASASAFSTASGMTMPATDSISPNPPNGKVFAGTGRYQLYRQGNLTWRLDTDTGQTCIIFATDEEWKQPRVMKAACTAH